MMIPYVSAIPAFRPERSGRGLKTTEMVMFLLTDPVMLLILPGNARRIPEMKPSISFLLGLLLLAAPAAQAQFNCATNNGTTITITTYTGSGGAVIIPSTINNLPVTGIGYAAFYQKNSITSVTIDTNVTDIGNFAFAFCGHLTNVTMANSLTSIGDYAFEGCGLTDISIPESVISIGEGTFGECDSLIAIAVAPGNLAYASVAGVLFDLGQTTLIEYPNGKVGNSYTIPTSVVSIWDDAFEDCYLTNVILPDGLINVGDEAFFGCNGLTSVSLPNGVASIGSEAFFNCLSLTNLTIPASVTSIADAPCVACYSLTTITVAEGNPAYSSVDGVLFDKTQTALLEFPGCPSVNYTIPGGVATIGDDAFGYCDVTSITIPNSVVSIGYSAFEQCANLTNVTIGSGVTSIGQYGFIACSGLTMVTIPNTVTNIGDFAFAGCGSLTGAYFEGNAPFDDGTVFNSDNNATVYYLPGTTGWGPTFGGVPTALWTQPNPVILTFSPIGVQAGGFGFTVSWATNLSVVVQACANLSNPVWQPLQTNTLAATPAGGTFYFSDPQWTNYPGRFYRISAP